MNPPRMRAVITGATGGIGSDLAALLAGAHHALVLAGRHKETLEQLADHCRSQGASEVAIAQWDALQDIAAGRLSKALEELTPQGEIVLVNGAGVASFGEFSSSDFGSIRAMVDINLIGTMGATRELLPLMIADGTGQIVNILSVAATHDFPGAAGYCASKAGALAFTRALNAEIRGKGVRVTAIIPGATDTPLWEGKGWVPPKADMLSSRAVADVIFDLLSMPKDRSVDELHLMPPKGVL